VRCDLGPGANPHPVGLGDLAFAKHRLWRRLTIAPDALLERPSKLGSVRLAHQIGALVIERGI
jgi:hypothetical protein